MADKNNQDDGIMEDIITSRNGMTVKLMVHYDYSIDINISFDRGRVKPDLPKIVYDAIIGILRSE